MRQAIFIITTLLLGPSAGADQSVSRFTPDNWSRGLHLFAGGGLEVARYFSRIGSREIRPGLGVATTVSYVFHPSAALELSSDAGFIPSQGGFLWSTSFSLGLRTRFPGVEYTKDGAPYLRYFVGWGPAVAFPTAESEQAPQLKDVRLQLHGPLGGVGGGYLMKNGNGKIWYVDLAFYVHAFYELEVVRPEVTRPVVIAQEDLGSRPLLISMHLVVGLLAF